MRFLVNILKSGKNYSALVPDLPGCVAAGDSIEEVRQLILEAIKMHLRMMRKSKEAIPTPLTAFDLDLNEMEEGEIYTWVEIKKPRALTGR